MCDDARARRRQRRRRRRRRMPFGEHVCVGVCYASAVLYLLVYVVCEQSKAYWLRLFIHIIYHICLRFSVRLRIFC